MAGHIKISESQVDILEAEIQTFEVGYRRVWPRSKITFHDFRVYEKGYTDNNRIVPNSWKPE